MTKFNSVYPHEVGKYAEALVQKSLWRRNYRVKDISYDRDENGRADLLVNSKYKVEVKSMRGNQTTLSLTPSKFDVLCIVVIGEFKSLIYYLKDKKTLPDIQIPGGHYKINSEKIKKLFTTNPKNIFI